MTSQTVEASGSRWYHGWNIVGVCILAQIACNGLTVSCFSLFLKDWTAALHTSVSSLQLAPAAMGLISSLAAAFVGGVVDRRPARWLLSIGLAALAIFYVAVGFVTAPWQIVVLYGTLLPIGVCLAGSLTVNAVVSRWFVRRRGLALGLSAFSIGLAGVILPPVIAVLAPTIGWRAIWQIAGAIIALIFLPLVLLIVRDRPGEAEGRYYLSGDGGGRALGHASAGASRLSWRAVFARPNFWLFVVVYLPILGIYGGGAQNLAPIASSHGLSRETAGFLLSALGLSYVVATLVLGMASDRLGARIPFFGLALVSGAGALLLAVGHGFILALVSAICIGAGGGLFPLLAAGLAMEFGSQDLGRAFGLAMTFIPVISFAPFAIAKSQEGTGSYAPALIGLAILAVIGGCLCLLIRERRSPHLTPAEEDAVVDEGVPLVR